MSGFRRNPLRIPWIHLESPSNRDLRTPLRTENEYFHFRWTCLLVHYTSDILSECEWRQYKTAQQTFIQDTSRTHLLQIISFNANVSAIHDYSVAIISCDASATMTNQKPTTKRPPSIETSADPATAPTTELHLTRIARTMTSLLTNVLAGF